MWKKSNAIVVVPFHMLHMLQHTFKELEYILLIKSMA